MGVRWKTWQGEKPQVRQQRALNGNCKNPQDRSDKACACGNHSTKARKPRKKNIRRAKGPSHD